MLTYMTYCTLSYNSLLFFCTKFNPRICYCNIAPVREYRIKPVSTVIVLVSRLSVDDRSSSLFPLSLHHQRQMCS